MAALNHIQSPNYRVDERILARTFTHRVISGSASWYFNVITQPGNWIHYWLLVYTFTTRGFEEDLLDAFPWQQAIHPPTQPVISWLDSSCEIQSHEALHTQA